MNWYVFFNKFLFPLYIYFSLNYITTFIYFRQTNVRNHKKSYCFIIKNCATTYSNAFYAFCIIVKWNNFKGETLCRHALSKMDKMIMTELVICFWEILASLVLLFALKNTRFRLFLNFWNFLLIKWFHFWCIMNDETAKVSKLPDFNKFVWVYTQKLSIWIA